MTPPNLKNREFIAANWHALSDRAMAEVLGISKWTVIRYRQDMELSRRVPNLSYRHEAEIVAEYVKGGYVSDIARKLGLNDSTVRWAVNKICVRRPEVAERRMAATRRAAISAILRRYARAKKRRPLPPLEYGEGGRKNTMLSAKKYAALFSDPYERFLMLMRRRQEVKELLLQAADVATDEKPEYNVVGHLLPHYKDLNRAVNKLAPCVGR